MKTYINSLSTEWRISSCYIKILFKSIN